MWKCPKCGREFKNTEQGHFCVKPNSIDEYIAEWRAKNPDKAGNIRDYTELEQLVVLSNMEGINALLIRQGLPQSERLIQLNHTAITQMKSLVGGSLTKRLK